MEQSGTRKFLIATHGTLSAGLRSALEMIAGEMANMYTIQAYTDANVDIDDELLKVMANVDDTDELIVFTDILGGSVTNQLMQQALKPNVHMVAGTSLPLLIDIVLGDPGLSATEAIESAIENARNQMVYVNKLLTQQTTDND